MPLKEKLERQEQVREILRASKPHSQRYDSMTLRWHDPSGAELWIYVDQAGTMKSVQPHFAGGPRIRLEIQAILERPEISPYDGGFLALTQLFHMRDVSTSFDRKDESARTGIPPVNYGFLIG